MTDSGSDGHLSGKQLAVVVRHNEVVKAHGCHLQLGNSNLDPSSRRPQCGEARNPVPLEEEYSALLHELALQQHVLYARLRWPSAEGWPVHDNI